MSSEESLPFLAIENGGMDVWLGNYRGNTYSRGHIKYTRKDPEYWNFDIGDHSMKDYPAMVSYIYN